MILPQFVNHPSLQHDHPDYTISCTIQSHDDSLYQPHLSDEELIDYLATPQPVPKSFPESISKPIPQSLKTTESLPNPFLSSLSSQAELMLQYLQEQQLLSHDSTIHSLHPTQLV